MLRWKGLQELGATCAAIATMLLVCGGALGETGSKIQAEAKKADRAGAHDRAIELYSTALSDASTSDAGRRDILKARAYLNERVKQIDRALEDWTSAIAIEPVAPRLYASRGFFYLRQRRYDDALADFAKGAALDEKSPIYAYGVGELHFDRLQYADAVSAYTKAIALDGQHTTSYLGRGLAHLQQDNLRDAQADFERVIVPQPLASKQSGKTLSRIRLGKNEKQRIYACPIRFG
jgi:tetratricopeptide (TPR) repeat protein